MAAWHCFGQQVIQLYFVIKRMEFLYEHEYHCESLCLCMRVATVNLNALCNIQNHITYDIKMTTFWHTLSINWWIWQKNIIASRYLAHKKKLNAIFFFIFKFFDFVLFFLSTSDVYNSAHIDLFRATLHFDGTIVWEPGGSFSTTCNIQIRYFPFDHQTCDLTFTVWQYTKDMMSVTNSSHLINIDTLSGNGEWVVKSTSMGPMSWHDPSNPEDVYSEVSSRLFQDPNNQKQTHQSMSASQSLNKESKNLETGKVKRTCEPSPVQ